MAGFYYKGALQHVMSISSQIKYRSKIKSLAFHNINSEDLNEKTSLNVRINPSRQVLMIDVVDGELLKRIWKILS